MCWYCGSPVTDKEPFGRSLLCPDCGKDMRVCKNCRLFLPGSRGDCAETNAEPMHDKERANFCDWFSLNPVLRKSGPGQAQDREKAASARSDFDNLFK